MYFGDSNLKVNSTVEINNEKVKVLDLLIPGDSIFTQYGQATKNEDGDFILYNGNTLDLSKDRNYKISNIISSAENIEEKLSVFLNMDHVENYGPRDVRILVNTILGVGSNGVNSSILDNIEIGFLPKKAVSFSMTEEGKLKLTISSNLTSENSLELYVALKYYDYCYHNKDQNRDDYDDASSKSSA